MAVEIFNHHLLSDIIIEHNTLMILANFEKSSVTYRIWFTFDDFYDNKLL